MPDELLTVFNICFLVLLYLFFFRVLRAVWTEVNAGTLAAPESTPSRGRRRSSGAAAVATVPAGPIAAPTPSRASARAERQAPAVAEPSKLVALDPPQLAGIEYPLAAGMTVGRGSAADIVWDDSFLSQVHASFDRRDGHWVIADLGSTNGTYLNRAKVSGPTRVGTGDQIQVGNVVLEVR